MTRSDPSALATVHGPSSAVDPYSPPWTEPPPAPVHFTVPAVDNVPDLHGTLYRPDLVALFGGNQFMVLPALFDAFRQAHPTHSRVFYETLPPGIVERQLREGSLVIGNLHIDAPPDLFVAGRGRLQRLHDEGLIETPRPYFSNRLAIMVLEGNPHHVHGLEDLARDDLRVSMPNPEIEGIATKAIEMLKKVGGDALAHDVMERKAAAGTTFITQIHHRQTPLRILRDESDAGVVWITEALFQRRLGHPIDYVDIPPAHNVTGTTAAAIVCSAAHRAAAHDLLAFLTGPTAAALYRAYGFQPAGGSGA